MDTGTEAKGTDRDGLTEIVQEEDGRDFLFFCALLAWCVSARERKRVQRVSDFFPFHSFCDRVDLMSFFWYFLGDTP